MWVHVLDYMPFDKRFWLEGGNSELCHATGREVCFDDADPEDPSNWWVEYEDDYGDLHYGR
jgi:hypothetical protein